MQQSLLASRWLMTACIALSLSCGEQVVVREAPAQCGNGTIESDEQCDDGNRVASDACTDGCQLARCGDAVLRSDLEPSEEGYEACDDGNTDEADAHGGRAPYGAATAYSDSISVITTLRPAMTATPAT